MSRLAWTRRLGVAVLALTFTLMVLGGWVKANGAGLSCPDWPQCYGEWLPPFPSSDNGGTYQGEPVAYTQALIMYEWTHRLVASVLGLPMLAFTFLALTGRTFHPVLRYLPLGAMVVLGLQVGIGGGTVVTGNPAWFTTLHLATATLFLMAMTVATAFAFLPPYPATPVAAAQQAAPSPAEPPAPRKPFGYVYKEGDSDG